MHLCDQFPTEQAVPGILPENPPNREGPNDCLKKKKANIPSWEERPNTWREKLRAVLTEQIQIPVKVKTECFCFLKNISLFVRAGS